MAQALFDWSGPKELWMVEGAKHNQAFQIANEQYRQRVLGFFDDNLWGGAGVRVPPSTPPLVGKMAHGKRAEMRTIGIRGRAASRVANRRVRRVWPNRH